MRHGCGGEGSGVVWAVGSQPCGQLALIRFLFRAALCLLLLPRRDFAGRPHISCAAAAPNGARWTIRAKHGHRQATSAALGYVCHRKPKYVVRYIRMHPFWPPPRIVRAKDDPFLLIQSRTIWGRGRGVRELKRGRGGQNCCRRIYRYSPCRFLRLDYAAPLSRLPEGAPWSEQKNLSVRGQYGDGMQYSEQPRRGPFLLAECAARGRCLIAVSFSTQSVKNSSHSLILVG